MLYISKGFTTSPLCFTNKALVSQFPNLLKMFIDYLHISADNEPK